MVQSFEDIQDKEIRIKARHYKVTRFTDAHLPVEECYTIDPFLEKDGYWFIGKQTKKGLHVYKIITLIMGSNKYIKEFIPFSEILVLDPKPSIPNQTVSNP